MTELTKAQKLRQKQLNVIPDEDHHQENWKRLQEWVRKMVNADEREKSSLLRTRFLHMGS